MSFKIKINFYVDFSTVNFSLLQLKTGTRFEVCFLHGFIFPNNGQCRVLSITIWEVDVWYPRGSCLGGP